mmetsp:Transcript_38148/g.50260  ORF Transcript_38148/g.50260 Transcript_38148/m.50260 type:complete len:105 (+) Transcript_38148:309-623(+)
MIINFFSQLLQNIASYTPTSFVDFLRANCRTTQNLNQSHHRNQPKINGRNARQQSPLANLLPQNQNFVSSEHPQQSNKQRIHRLETKWNRCKCNLFCVSALDIK